MKYSIPNPDNKLWAAGVPAVLIALCMLGVFFTASANAAELVSVNSAGTDSGNGFSLIPEISADGRFVAFESGAIDLVPTTDNNGTRDIFVRDLQTGTTTLVSVNSAGTASGNGFSSMPEISADGRFVAFRSNASDLVATDTNRTGDVFVRDLQTETTTLVSVNSAGTDSGNRFSLLCEISGDGRFVAFESVASDLVVTDTNGSRDVFVRDLQTETTTLVSVNSAGTDSGDSTSGNSVISGDGRFVAFHSNASNLVATDFNGTADVFVRDLQTGTTALVSVNSAGTDSGNTPSSTPKISGDGRFVAFLSYASDLVATDTNGTRDVFVRDLQAGITTLVSVNSFGTDSGNCVSQDPVISDDGRFVAFLSDASDLVATDTNGFQDVFVRDLQTGTTTLVSVNSAGTDSGNTYSVNPEISGDGRFVAFHSFASDLVATDTNETGDVFVRNLQTGTTTLVSVNSAVVDSGDDNSSNPKISADGRFVAFRSDASDLVATDTNEATDVFVFGTTKACNCNDPEAITGGPGFDFLIGTQGDDIICGFEGKDLIFGLKGNDCIDGGDGKDLMFGGRGDDTIDGGDGVDKIFGGKGMDECGNGEFVFGCEQ